MWRSLAVCPRPASQSAFFSVSSWRPVWSHWDSIASSQLLYGAWVNKRGLFSMISRSLGATHKCLLIFLHFSLCLDSCSNSIEWWSASFSQELKVSDFFGNEVIIGDHDEPLPKLMFFREKILSYFCFTTPNKVWTDSHICTISKYDTENECIQ